MRNNALCCQESPLSWKIPGMCPTAVAAASVKSRSSDRMLTVVSKLCPSTGPTDGRGRNEIGHKSGFFFAPSIELDGESPENSIT